MMIRKWLAYFLMMTLMSAQLAWATDVHALAEEGVQVEVNLDAHTPLHASGSSVISSDMGHVCDVANCDHGCHSIAHFLGLVSVPQSVSFVAPSQTFSHVSVQFRSISVSPLTPPPNFLS